MKKTDNSKIKEKLLIRRMFLDKYHKGKKISVIDCCSGGRVVWNTLRRKYDTSYWPIDEKNIKGTMRGNSVKVLAAGATADVIDVDTYGKPWKHWAALLPHIKAPITIFLTIGRVGGMCSQDKTSIRNICPALLNAPRTIVAKFEPEIIRQNISMATKYGLKIDMAIRAESRNATYIGIHLIP